MKYRAPVPPPSPAVAADPGATAAADAQLREIYTTEWEWRKRQLPPTEDSAKDAVLDRLPDVGEAQQIEKLDYWQSILRSLDGICVSDLSAHHLADYQVYRFQIESLIADQRLKMYECPLSGDTSFWGDLADTARRAFRTEAQYRDYISQLSDFPRYFRQNIDNMRAGLRRRFTPPRLTLNGRDAGVVSVTDAPTVEDNVYYKPFKSMPSAIPAQTQRALRDEGAAAIAQKVLPAHRELLTFLRSEYVPGARTSIAAHDLPDGASFYRAQIRKYVTRDMTPEEIHRIGLTEVAKIRGEMSDVMREIRFAGDLKAFLEFLRTDRRFQAAKPQELLDRAAWTAKTFDGKASEYFGRLPRRRFAIVPVPDEIAPFFTGGRGGPGTYMVNTYDLPSRLLFSLPALTLHESAPGHAFQMSLAAENDSLPPFRRDTFISAYGEGWALYCERLGDEMGIYESPFERFGMLSYQMWRAARLVVDTGIHAASWSREQAQRYLRDSTALADHEITTEVDRYIACPGQALSYHLGQMDFWKNRRRAEASLGDKFNIRAFHDAMMALGSVPLGLVDAATDRFIADGGIGPYPDEE